MLSGVEYHFKRLTFIEMLVDLQVMKLGISTWAYQDLPLAKALERISRLSNHAEILCEAKHSLLDPENQDVLESFSLEYTIHGLVTDVNIASIYPGIRRASVEIHRQAIEASANIGAALYVLHPGYAAWLPCRPKALRSLGNSLEELAAAAEDYEIIVAVENMPKSDWLFFHRPGMNLRGMNLVLDVGHAHTCGSLDAFLEQDDIAHMHLHDNSGQNDDHLPLGHGGIDFQPVLRVAEERGIVAVLEHKSEELLLESLDNLKNFLAIQHKYTAQ
jgi:sugar phosphate isomerase/epimerase